MQDVIYIGITKNNKSIRIVLKDKHIGYTYSYVAYFGKKEFIRRNAGHQAMEFLNLYARRSNPDESIYCLLREGCLRGKTF